MALAQQLAGLAELSVVGWGLKLTGLLLIAWLAHALTAQASAAWRVWLWRCTALAVLVLPVLVLVAPAIEVPALATRAAPRSAEQALRDGSDRAQPRFQVGGSQTPPAVPGSELADPAREATMQSSAAPATSDGPPELAAPAAISGHLDAPFDDPASRTEVPRVGGRTWLIAVWLLGCVAMALRPWLAGARVRGWLASASRAAPELEAELAQAAHDLGVRRVPDLLRSPNLATPLLIGVRRPRMLLPDEFCRGDHQASRRAIFAHELSHVRGADLAWSRLLEGVRAVCWFQPLLWGVAGAHERACEEVSDAVAASYVGSVRRYSRLLASIALKVNGEFPGKRFVPCGGVSMARVSEIKRRLARLEGKALSRRLTKVQLALCLAAALALSAVVGSLTQAYADPTADAAAASTADVAPDTWVNDLQPITVADWSYARAAHLLERAGFGGTPPEIAKLAAMAPADAVDYLVDYHSIDASGLPEFERSGIYPHGHKLISLEKMVPKAVVTGKAYGIKATREGPLPYQPAINEFYTLLFSEYMEMQRASQWWAQRMLLTPRPLEEKLTLFWHDHFATSQAKVLNFELMLRQIDTLRTHASGNFRALLVAIAQDPAMLIWLDNRDNVQGKPNENFAREVMELFTMGEGHGYTEHDIREMARAFTGWTLRAIETVDDSADFVDDPRLHDDGEKTFLGQTGKFNGYDAIDIILQQPAAARFIAGKLYQHFVREGIDPTVNDRLADQFVAAKYELKPLLKTMFLSRDFYSEPSCGTQIKSPVHFLVSTSRKLGLSEIPGIPDFVETSGSQLGQLLFQPPNVAGWPGNNSWINPATLLSRGNYVYSLLFPEPDTFIPPDKAGPEGYRKIPLLFQEYNIVPHVWNAKSQRMEPVSLAEYDRYLAGVSAGMMSDDRKPEARPGQAAQMMKPDANQPKSKMAQLSQGERYNLAVGVYTGYVEAYNRVQAIPRRTAQIDFAALARDGGVDTAEQAVDYFSRRFLSVPLEAARRAAVVDFLRQELGADRVDLKQESTERALRAAVHLILSAPEYQLG